MKRNQENPTWLSASLAGTVFSARGGDWKLCCLGSKEALPRAVLLHLSDTAMVNTAPHAVLTPTIQLFHFIILIQLLLWIVT